VCRGRGAEGDPCHATRPCDNNLTCEAFTHMCRAPGGVGDACHATRPCNKSLACASGVHKCFHAPRLACEPCVSTADCSSGQSCQMYYHICRGTSDFEITVKWAPSPAGVKAASSKVKDAMTKAVDRWRRVIRDHLHVLKATMPKGGHADYKIEWASGVLPAGSEWNDLMIVVRIAGPNESDSFKAGSTTIAHARPAFDDVHRMPRLGVIEINQDLMDSDTPKYTEEVLMHEIGHVLGMNAGNFRRMNLLSADGKFFVGENAVEAYKSLGGKGSVPLQWDEADGKKPGGHWDPNAVKTELMDPQADQFSLLGVPIVANMPTSKLTLGALRDFGYTVNDCEAQPVELKPGAKSGPEGRIPRPTNPREDYLGEITPSEGHWGTWREPVWCPEGTWAAGFSQRVEADQGGGDDSALNSVRLHCRSRNGGTITTISSHEGWWGDWSDPLYCQGEEYIRSALLRVEPDQGGGDDSAATDFRPACETGPLVAPNGLKWGTYSNINAGTCPNGTAVCGLSIRLEDKQAADVDDSAMNGIRLQCCYEPKAYRSLFGPPGPANDSIAVRAGPGKTVAFYSPTHKRFLRMQSATVIDSNSPADGSSKLPSDWTWERWKVVKAGSGADEIALHNVGHGRYLQMDKSGVMSGTDKTVALNNAKAYFTVQDLGGGEVALYSSYHKRYVRMNDKGMIDTSASADGKLAASSQWERFKLVDAP